jgi:hypothetical protein
VTSLVPGLHLPAPPLSSRSLRATGRAPGRRAAAAPHPHDVAALVAVLVTGLVALTLLVVVPAGHPGSTPTVPHPVPLPAVSAPADPAGG